MKSTLASIQKAVADRLVYAGSLRGIPVLQHTTDIADMLAEASKATKDLWILVEGPTASKADSSGSTPTFTQLDIAVYIYEATLGSNRSRPAIAVAENVLRALYHWTPGVSGVLSALQMANSDAIVRDTSRRKQGYNIIQVNMQLETNLPQWPDLG